MRFAAVVAFITGLGACSPVDATPPRAPAAAIPSHAVRALPEGTTVRVEAGDEVAVRLPSDARDWSWSATGRARLEARASDDPAVLRLAVVGAGRAEARFRRQDGSGETLTVVIESR